MSRPAPRATSGMGMLARPRSLGLVEGGRAAAGDVPEFQALLPGHIRRDGTHLRDAPSRIDPHHQGRQLAAAIDHGDVLAGLRVWRQKTAEAESGVSRGEVSPAAGAAAIAELIGL